MVTTFWDPKGSLGEKGGVTLGKSPASVRVNPRGLLLNKEGFFHKANTKRGIPKAFRDTGGNNYFFLGLWVGGTLSLHSLELPLGDSTFST